jgi:hypothetical protein
MNKPISLVLLIVGIILIVYGTGASNSIGSSVSRTFTGSPTEKTIWLLVLGAIAAVAGLAGIIRGPKSE